MCVCVCGFRSPITRTCYLMYFPQDCNRYEYESRKDERKRASLALEDIENSSCIMSPLSPLFPPSTQSSLLEEDISSEDAVTYHILRKPIFTVLYTGTILFLFLYGIYFIAGRENVEYSRMSPVSPPIEKLYFSTASAWPFCEDTRSQWWRLFSHQVIGYCTLLYCTLLLISVWHD